MYDAIKKHLVTEPLIHADETVLQVLKEPGRKATTESRMWVYTSGQSPTPAVLFEYQPTRSGQHARRFLEGFSGYLQTDGYSGYNAVPDVIHCGCWAHLQRKFEEAFLMEQIAKVPRRLLDMITVTAYLPWERNGWNYLLKSGTKSV